jgi:hemerythrin-like domain-containing protein
MITSADAVGPVATVEMKALHSAFRREFGMAAALVRAVPPGAVTRAVAVEGHLEFVERFLHHHHTLEDELLWPKLLGRVPVEIAPVVELMESQHEVVADCLQRTAALRGEWRTAADPAVGEQLASLYQRLNAALVEHLDAEESRVMPLVETAIAEAEWAELAKAGQAAFPGREGLLLFGMIQRDAGDDVVAQMLSAAPAPVRYLMPKLARRSYRKHSRLLAALG